MELKLYFFAMSPESRESFASRCGTTLGHMRNVAYGYREPSTELAVAIERESNGECSRRDMFPDTYPAKWPELATEKEGA
ncbi:YdaS family helix-turn-helix protein [Xenophilus sp. Marseille-Q4582]|uniref:transcriptional regulator n=1 Tax=Xenophilus sp. Marseille-Q4582 TaxID=2866600 RepID=UPI001CE421C6|nr:YdaS family helix-turn-helix protein [Xenophilus sp. Marseille-Q4582]